ncbi:MAG: hypothetical protein E7394_03980 [Ruminococcaceae bacterium]|nr:hypothetical protein [Oscillospiraceae bacterium]
MKIRLYHSSAIAFFIFTFFGSLTPLLCGYTAVFIHEMIHLFICCLLKEEAEEICLDIWGMHLKIRSTHDTKKSLLIWASGPIFSLFLSGVLFSFGRYDYFSYANFCVGIVNLLPVIPLDGAMVLNTVLSRFFGTLKSDAIMKKVSFIICSASFFLCIFCLFKGIMNISFFIFSIMLILSQKKGRIQSVIKCSEVLTKRKNKTKKVRLIFMDSTDDILKVLRMISPNYTLFILVFENEKFLGFLTQEEFLNIICSSNNLLG